MPQLHLIQQSLNLSKFSSRFDICVNAGDTILFLNDALFSLTSKAFNSDEFLALISNNPVVFIAEQMEARAILELVSKKVTAIDFPEFAKLSQNACKTISW